MSTVNTGAVNQKTCALARVRVQATNPVISFDHALIIDHLFNGLIKSCRAVVDEDDVDGCWLPQMSMTVMMQIYNSLCGLRL